MIEMFKYLTGTLERKEQRTWKLYAVFGLISPIVDIFSFSVIIYIINRVVQDNQVSDKLIIFTLFMILLSLLKCLFELYKSKVSNRFIYDGAQKLSMKIYELLIKEELMEHNRKTAMQALNMVRNDTTSCIQIIVDCIGIVVNGITMAGYGVVLIYVSKWVGVASSVILLLLMAFVFIRTRARMIVYGEKSRACSIKANSQITIAYGSFKEMKIDDRSAFVLGKYRDASNDYARVQGEYKYKVSSIGVILQNSIMAAMFVVLAVILVFGTNLAVILAPMVVYITALVRMLPMAYGVLSGMNNVEFARKSYEAVKECMAGYEKIREEEERSRQIRRKKLTFEKGVSVRNLTFGYNDRAKIFEDASIDIPVGCSIAIIGASGAGKTTFVDLLLGLLKPQSGHVFFDDYDIVEQRDSQGPCRASMGELVSYIPQTVYLNGETVQNNVAFFEDEGEIDKAKVEECLRCAQIWEDVMRMPDGVDTLIGENGTAISGGQRQRIALARALYKDFELLVMDEATAALDMETEMAVIDSIRQIKEDKTLIMVTHHMSLANECDVIYRIENRKIVQVKGN
ncbi:ABC transporter ATP-binding protein [uncultured Acetatifactor sp.]|uniref:ABC transporter ATP-binding protein n=1 Tax=uncultured Acetatifactor sp. TaxID=1671927 RepID=UPI00262B7C64|nr:ABC transporter ATP-binding protein [uncultured Acetatifactor sp.]